jgi:hypothetical protein
MNPYLEQPDVWQDFHQSFMPAIRESLSAQVTPGYIVKIEEHIYIHEPPAEQRLLIGRADVSVVRRSGGVASGSAVLEPPARIRLPDVDIERNAYVEIRDRQSRELVTVIELLSPTNKRPGPDREQYLAKRAQLLRSTVHFIEIDLLRGWERMPLQEPPRSDYCVLVSRAEERPEAGLWPLRLRDRLPIIPIPLRAPSPDARLDLHEILDRVYDAAYYRDYIYTGIPDPPLGSDDAAWARQYL